VQRPCRKYFAKFHPEVQRSFGSGSAAFTSKLLQSPIQKCSVHSGPEVQPQCRNYFKVRSRSTAFISVRKCSVHVESILQSPIQKCSVHSGPEVQRPRRNYCKVSSRSTAFIRFRKCSLNAEIISKSKKKNNWRHSNNMNTYSPVPKRKKQK
jgi:hypothetical protein